MKPYQEMSREELLQEKSHWSSSIKHFVKKD